MICTWLVWDLFANSFPPLILWGPNAVIHTATSMDLIGSIRICTLYWLWKNYITRYADGGWCSTFAVSGLTFLPFVSVYLWYHELVFNSPDYLYLYLSPIKSRNVWKSQCLLFKLGHCPARHWIWLKLLNPFPSLEPVPFFEVPAMSNKPETTPSNK